MKIKYIILFLALFILINTVSAYEIVCYDQNEIMPGGVICNYECCHVCQTESGYSTLPQYCLGLDDCVCDGVYNPPEEPPEEPSGDCNCTEIENRLSALESDVTAIQSVLNTLQNLVNTIQDTINSILARLTALENDEPTPIGCTYDNPPCEEGYECIGNTCVLIEECIENWQCTAWNDCQPDETQTRTCTDSNNCGTTENKPIEIQSCTYVPPDEVVIFRTNVANSRYGSSNGEIVFDYDKDGDLDCFKYFSFYKYYTSRRPVILGQTIEGYDIHKYTRDAVIIYYGKNYIYKLSDNCETPLTNIPTEPYASNGQELYD